MIKSIILVIVYHLILVNSYSTYTVKIPNGNLVPNPCKLSEIWKGVGHENIMGGGARNNFGKDFAAKNHVWSAELCRLDSDGDGRTNGEELGDPNCIWKEGNLPTRTDKITHPGICEPLNSASCDAANDWLTCTISKCSATDLPDVKNLTVRFARTNIPANATNYYCAIFPLPTDQLYDVIALDPLIDNMEVAHHMLLFGCRGKAPVYKDPFSCKMGEVQNCTDLIGLWSAGGKGTCYPNEFGFRIGNESYAYKFLILQIHWTNYDHKTNLYDSSGMNIFYTPNLRPNMGSILSVAQFDLFLPPRISSLTASGYCSSQCSSKHVNNSIIMSLATVHMHLLGRRGSIEHFRNGKFLQYILPDHAYDYNSPEIFELKPRITFLSGDEIRVNCTFTTSDRRTLTRFGQGTLDEMCIGFIIYYPSQTPFEFRECSLYRYYPVCNDYDQPVCDFTNIKAYITNILTNCSEFCSKRCYELIDEFKTTGCYSNASFQFGNYIQIGYFYDLLDKCAIDAVKTCNSTKATDIGALILTNCSFACEPDCVQLVADYRKTGCVEVAWRYITRKPEIEMLAAYIMSCEQFVSKTINEGDNSSTLVPNNGGYNSSTLVPSNVGNNSSTLVPDNGGYNSSTLVPSNGGNNSSTIVSNNGGNNASTLAPNKNGNNLSTRASNKGVKVQIGLFSQFFFVLFYWAVLNCK